MENHPDRGLGPIPGPETLLPRARGDTVDGRSPDLRIILKIAFPDRSSGCTNARHHPLMGSPKASRLISCPLIQ